MRNWTGRGKHHFGRVRLDESPLEINLSWHITSNGPTFLGKLKLDLEKLLAQKHVRIAPGTQGKEVVLRFYRDTSDDFFIQTKNDVPGLPLKRVRS